MSNGNGISSLRWAVGISVLVIVGWLTALSLSVSASATKDEMVETEHRVTTRLERIEDKVDRLLER